MRRLLPQIATVIILFIITSTFVPATSPPVQAQIDDGACGVSHYDISDGSNYVFLGNRIHSPCPISCPPHQPDAAAGHYSDDINSPVAQYWCAGTPRPPDKPAVNAGQICLPGDSRTVTLAPSGGDSHQIEMNPGSVVSGTSHTFTGLLHNTAYRFRGQSSDSGGSSGWSDWTPFVYQDRQPPTTTVDAVGITGNNGWYTGDVSLALLGNDDGCLGVVGTHYTLNGANTTGTNVTITTEGVNTLSVYSTDGHNAEIPHNHTIRIDKTPPSVSVSPDRLPDVSSGWWTSPVTMTVSASDGVSGLATQTYTIDGSTWQDATAPITLSLDGVYEFDVRAIDSAGWISYDGVVIPLDQTPPSLSISTDRPNDGTNGWWMGDVTITLTATDATSGIQDTVYSLDGGTTWLPYTTPFTLSANGRNTVHAVTRDHAGHVTSQQMTVPIDKTLPFVEIQINGTIDHQTWYAQPPVLRASYSDNVSGIEGVYIQWAGSTVGRYTGAFQVVDAGWHEFSYFARNQAGWQTSAGTVGFGIDPTPPQMSNLTLRCNSDSIVIGAEVTDRYSGVARVEVRVGDDPLLTEYTPAVSNQTVTYSQTLSRTEQDITLIAIDDVGHESRVTLSCRDVYAAVVLSEYDTWPDDFLSLPFFVPPPTTSSPAPIGGNVPLSLALWEDAGGVGGGHPSQQTSYLPATVLPTVSIWRDEQPIASGQVPMVWVDPENIARLQEFVPPELVYAQPLPEGEGSPANTSALPMMILWEDSTPQTSAAPEAMAEALPLDESAINSALAAMAALATVGAGVVATASSRRRQEEAEQLRAEQESALGDALADQQAKLEANHVENLAKQEAAQGIAVVQAAMSDWMKRYLDLVAGYGDRVRLWQEAVVRQQVREIAQNLQEGLNGMAPFLKSEEKLVLEKELGELTKAIENKQGDISKLTDTLQGVIVGFTQASDAVQKRANVTTVNASFIKDDIQNSAPAATRGIPYAPGQHSLSAPGRPTIVIQDGDGELEEIAVANYKMVGYQNYLHKEFGVELKNIASWIETVPVSFQAQITPRYEKWDLQSTYAVYQATDQTARALFNNTVLYGIDYLNDDGVRIDDPAELFRRTIGPVEVLRKTSGEYSTHWQPATDANLIYLAGSSSEEIAWNFMRGLGVALDNRSFHYGTTMLAQYGFPGSGYQDTPIRTPTGNWTRREDVYPDLSPIGVQSKTSGSTLQDEWADTFAYWVHYTNFAVERIVEGKSWAQIQAEFANVLHYLNPVITAYADRLHFNGLGLEILQDYLNAVAPDNEMYQQMLNRGEYEALEVILRQRLYALGLSPSDHFFGDVGDWKFQIDEEDGSVRFALDSETRRLIAAYNERLRQEGEMMPAFFERMDYMNEFAAAATFHAFTWHSEEFINKLKEQMQQAEAVIHSAPIYGNQTLHDFRATELYAAYSQVDDEWNRHQQYMRIDLDELSVSYLRDAYDAQRQLLNRLLVRRTLDVDDEGIDAIWMDQISIKTNYANFYHLSNRDIATLIESDDQRGLIAAMWGDDFESEAIDNLWWGQLDYLGRPLDESVARVGHPSAWILDAAVLVASVLSEPLDWAVSAYEIARALAEGNSDEAALIFALAVTPVAGYSLYRSGIFDQAGTIIRQLGDDADWLGREIGDWLFDSRRLRTANDELIDVRVSISITGGNGPSSLGNSSNSVRYGAREYNPDQAGGAIRNLNYTQVQITHTGIDVVEHHLSRFNIEDIIHEQKMVERLRQIANGEILPTEWDLRFYTHELREFVRYRILGWKSGQPLDDAGYTLWNNTHTATLADYNIHDFLYPNTDSRIRSLYHPEVWDGR